MSNALVAPAATDGAEAHADWLELLALSKDDKNSSFEDLVRELRRSGSTEALEDFETIEEITDEGSERSQAVAEDALGEVSDRLTACGSHPVSYPFEVQPRYIQARANFDDSVYVFLLVLSTFGKDAGPSTLDGADLFEQVSAYAAEQYLGGADRGAKRYLFGFPRRVSPAGFRDAVDDLCVRIGEGGRSRNRPTRSDQKDAKLDLVVWRAFDDGRVGKLIGFGQCATGHNWRTKLSELQTPAFWKKWITEPAAVDPVRMFFVPFRVEAIKWDDASIDGGILFDRCRIASLAANLDDALRRSCRRWTRHVLKGI